MKTSNLRVISLLMLLSTLFSLRINAQVGIGTTNPNPTSMLDIQSDAKGVLIPRMLTTDRTGISTPANGLLVFDIDTQSFWFYDVSAWRELGIGSSIHDIDGDTKIEVEKVTDTDPNGDEINFTTRNAERMKIGNDGVTEIGTPGTNYTKIEADGSLSYQGAATRWDDLRVPLNSAQRKYTTNFKPVPWGADSSGNPYIDWFDKTGTDEMYFVAQLPHAWKEGTTIYPHIHWISSEADNDYGDIPLWKLQYAWFNIGESIPTYKTVESTSVVPDESIKKDTQYLSPLGTGLDGTGKRISSIIVCRIYRDGSNSADKYGTWAGALEVDFHYEIDSNGSRETLTK